MVSNMHDKAIIIAEAGVNHNGDLGLARELIEKAARAGADYVKFQTFKAERIVTTSAEKASYQKEGTDTSESQLEMIRKLEIDRPAHEELIAHCKKHTIGFLSTPFDLESIDLLGELDVPAFKIPSGEITNLPYLRKISMQGKPVYLSTGMADIGEIRDAIDVLVCAGLSKEDIIVLHCNTEYPTPFPDVHLRAMLTIGSELGVRVGYSDHTLGHEVPIAAIALGARLIEKHFTLDRTMKGPDHAASMEPQELKAMVRSIRNTEIALGRAEKLPSESEKKNIPIVRKSIVASRPIEKGEIFSEDNLTCKRPGTGISPMHWDLVIGCRALRAFSADEMIER